jgi:hypothetical protein
MTPVRQEIVRAIAELSDRYPDWRFGQLVVNVANWASNPPLPESVWDVDDEAFLAAVREHLDRRFGRPVPTDGARDDNSPLASRDPTP